MMVVTTRYDSARDNHVVLGRTKTGRWLVVVWVGRSNEQDVPGRPVRRDERRGVRG